MTDPIKTYRDLIAWQRAFRLGLGLHRIAGTLPDGERFGLAAQVRRGATDVASNIAQGYGRGNTADYVWFLKSARSDLYKLDTQLLFSVELGYVKAEQYEGLKSELDECERVLAGLIRSLGG
jgi:four helix bundle protein